MPNHDYVLRSDFCGMDDEKVYLVSVRQSGQGE